MPEVKLRCQPGDTVYIILERVTGGYDLFETSVSAIDCYCTERHNQYLYKVEFPYIIENHGHELFSFSDHDFRKRIFISLPEAQKKLDMLNCSHKYYREAE